MDKDKLRPVMYQAWEINPETGKYEHDPERPGFFHTWVLTNERGCWAIVEKVDGTLIKVDDEDMRFTDRKGGDVK